MLNNRGEVWGGSQKIQNILKQKKYDCRPQTTCKGTEDNAMHFSGCWAHLPVPKVLLKIYVH